ncbi:MAG: HlyC/CorC family transporter [Anaerolineae bacterium]|nr:HlyC/CorC family transporter [Anaerolineae bacterium]
MELLFLLLLTIVNGILAMAETAIISARKARLEQAAAQGDPRARVTLEMANDPNRFLSTTQIGITLVGIFTGAFGGVTVAENLAVQLAQVPALEPYALTISITLVVALTTYLSLVIGELVPKRLALINPERVALTLVPALSSFSRLTGPLVRLLGLSTDAALRIMGIRNSEEPPVTPDEIRMLMRQGVQAGVFEATESELVESVFSLADRRVLELMTPRTEIEWLDLNDPLESNVKKLVASEHSNFPVTYGSLDQVIGVVRAKDVLDRVLQEQKLDLNACIRPPLYIPENATSSHALELFKKSGKHVALVVDEHGGIDGIITLNNLVEQLLGTEEEEPQAIQRADGSWLMDGLIPVEDAREYLGITELEDESEGRYTTLGGYMMAHLGRIPKPTDSFTSRGYRFEVMDMDGLRVDKVLVYPEPVAEQA